MIYADEGSEGRQEDKAFRDIRHVHRDYFATVEYYDYKGQCIKRINKKGGEENGSF
jgi:hypothetical protein